MTLKTQDILRDISRHLGLYMILFSRYLDQLSSYFRSEDDLEYKICIEKMLIRYP